MFNQLAALTARQQMVQLGAVRAVVMVVGRQPVETIAVVDRDVEVVIDDGRALTRRTVLSLLRQDVGRVGRSDTVRTYPNPADLSLVEDFAIGDVLSDDGFVVDVYVRE